MFEISYLYIYTNTIVYIILVSLPVPFIKIKFEECIVTNVIALLLYNIMYFMLLFGYIYFSETSQETAGWGIGIFGGFNLLILPILYVINIFVDMICLKIKDRRCHNGK